MQGLVWSLLGLGILVLIIVILNLMETYRKEKAEWQKTKSALQNLIDSKDSVINRLGKEKLENKNSYGLVIAEKDNIITTLTNEKLRENKAYSKLLEEKDIIIDNLNESYDAYYDNFNKTDKDREAELANKDITISNLVQEILQQNKTIINIQSYLSHPIIKTLVDNLEENGSSCKLSSKEILSILQNITPQEVGILIKYLFPKCTSKRTKVKGENHMYYYGLSFKNK